jgi:hypothetical protein
MKKDAGGLDARSLEDRVAGDIGPDPGQAGAARPPKAVAVLGAWK